MYIFIHRERGVRGRDFKELDHATVGWQVQNLQGGRLREERTL